MLFRGTGQPARLPSCLPAFDWTELCWFGWKSCRWISPNPRSNLVLPFFTLILRRLGLDRNKLHLWCSQRSWGWSFPFPWKYILTFYNFQWNNKSNILNLGSDLCFNWVRGKCGGKRIPLQWRHALCRRKSERQLQSEEKPTTQMIPSISLFWFINISKDSNKLLRETAEEPWQ